MFFSVIHRTLGKLELFLPRCIAYRIYSHGQN